ncbi:MAG TPA: 6-carboxytetrahydropterin synthase QueD [Longimicrobiales bacterium]|nr:6-carboxytetrahydropterin synthase QueD [Longimicrobiales bacterium]
MYVVTVQSHYDSAHYLRNYKGKCENLHGHRYVVEVALGAEHLDDGGLAFDFVEVKKHLRDLTEHLDHQNLNDLFPFTEIEPSAENQARYIHDQLKERLPERMAAALLYARVWETPTQWAQYSERPLW